MAGEWRSLTLAEIGNVITGRTPPASSPEHFGGEMPFLTPTDMDGRRTVGITGRSLSTQGVDALRRSVVRHGVAVSCIGFQMGKSLLVDVPVITNQQINSVVPDPALVDDRFLYYALSSRRDEIFGLGAGGSRTPILNKSEFERLTVHLPPLQVQRTIAQILGTLDDKIELNRRMSATLEEMARALFKSWFVDFDPVRAKAEGRPTGLPSEIDALFPDSFEDSEVGEIPSGWQCSTVGEITDVIDCLHAKKPERCNTGKLFLQLNNIRNDGLIDLTDTFLISEVDYQKWISRIEVRTGDCVITNVGRAGAVAQIPGGLKAAMGRNMTAIRCRAEFPYPTFLIQCLISDSMREEIRTKLDTGTILDALNVRNIPKLRFVRPPGEVLSHYENAIRPVRSTMEQNLAESGTIAALRDTLLPKLMSGEIQLDA